MGLLDSNKVLVKEQTGLEGSRFNLLSSNDAFDIWEWTSAGRQDNLRVTFRDVFAWSDSYKLFLVQGKITDTPIEITVNTTNFPNLRTNSGGSTPRIEKVIACPFAPCTQTGSKYGHFTTAMDGKYFRICVIFSNGQIYHNFPSCYDDSDFYDLTYAVQGSTKISELFTKFDESVVWDIAGRKNPTNDLSLVETGVYYYNPALPSNCYEMHPAVGQSNGYGNTAGFAATNRINNVSNNVDIGVRARFWRTNMDHEYCNSFFYMGGYVADNQFTMIGTYRSNVGNNPCRMCVFGTQDGGRSWYNMYEFSGKERLKIDSRYVDADGTIGINLSQVATASSGIYNVKRRSLIIPTASNKEPSELFDYEEPLDIVSIFGTSSAITITTASAHNYKKGDAVIISLQDNASLDNRAFDWMVNSSANETSGGNGVIFVVNDVTSTTFTLMQYIWNPNSNLPIRHIHALNLCKDGVSVSCGEAYPRGGWILYNAIQAADTFAHYNVASDSNVFIRLNSTVDSFQRPLGTIIQQEGEDTYCYVGVDNEYTPMNDVAMPEGRTQTFKHNSCGVWKVKIDGIDSQKDNGLIKYNTRQTAYGFQKEGTAFVYVGQMGDFAVSYDNGESWVSAQLPSKYSGISNFSGLTYDNKFSINNILVRLKK